MPAERIVFGPDFFEVDPRSTALIVVDMQNGFVAEGAAYETPSARDMLDRLAELIGFAREHEMPVIWTQSDHSAPAGGIMLEKFPAIRDDHVLWRGEESFELFAPMVQPREGEHR